MTHEEICILSGSTENLNTSMVVKLDDGRKITVYVCDEEADDATPRKCKEAYLAWEEEHMKEEVEKRKKMEELQKLAKEMGMTLTPEDVAANQAPVVVGNEPVQQNVKPVNQVNTQQPRPKGGGALKPMKLLGKKSDPAKPSDTLNVNLGESYENFDEADLLDGKFVDNKSISYNVNATAGANPYGTSVANEYNISSSEETTEDLKAGEKARIGKVKGRGGVDVAIPVERRGKMGHTQVTVVDTGGDAELQRRFKATSRIGDHEEPVTFGQGYQVKTVQCTVCRGTGYIAGTKNICPKCNGTGMIDYA